jgi:hypothetical protein
LRRDPGAPGLGAIGAEHGDALPAPQAAREKGLLHAPDQIVGRRIAHRAAVPGEREALRIAPQRAQRLGAERGRRVELRAHGRFPNVICE